MGKVGKENAIRKILDSDGELPDNALLLEKLLSQVDFSDLNILKGRNQYTALFKKLETYQKIKDWQRYERELIISIFAINSLIYLYAPYIPLCSLSLFISFIAICLYKAEIADLIKDRTKIYEPFSYKSQLADATDSVLAALHNLGIHELKLTPSIKKVLFRYQKIRDRELKKYLKVEKRVNKRLAEEQEKKLALEKATQLASQQTEKIQQKADMLRRQYPDGIPDSTDIADQSLDDLLGDGKNEHSSKYKH